MGRRGSSVTSRLTWNHILHGKEGNPPFCWICIRELSFLCLELDQLTKAVESRSRRYIFELH